MTSDNRESERVGDVVICRTPGMVSATLDRPKVINALNDGIVQGLERALALTLEADSILFVLRGSGGNFCAGADLKYVSTLFADLDNGLFKYIDRLRKICNMLADGPFVSLAVIEGYALAGGYEILTACDLAVSTVSASIGDRHLEYALAPGLGASVRIGHHLSSKQARYLAFTGNMLTGTEAAAWGLVSHAWDTDTFEKKTSDLIARLASRSPAAVRSYKKMLRSAERSSFDEAMRFEESAFNEYQRSSSDARAGVARFKDEKSGKI